MKKTMTALAIGICAGLAAMTAAQATSRVEVGVLSCNIGGGSGLVITSSKALNCTFKHSEGGSENYAGSINKFGIDIGTTKEGKLVWAVFAPTREVPPGALAGTYGGVGAEATIGAGVGANALIGGFGKSIALQPLSVQSQQGLNLAAGISSIQLNAVR